MADIVLAIPNSQIARVVNALCIDGGYAGDPADQAARRDFAKSAAAACIRELVLRVERGQATERAMSAAVAVNPVTID